jgi:hypothetical protein
MLNGELKKIYWHQIVKGKKGVWELKSWVLGQAIALFVSKKKVFGNSTIDVTIDAILYMLWKQN